MDIVVASLSVAAVMTLGPALLIDILVHQGLTRYRGSGRGFYQGGEPAEWVRPLRWLRRNVERHLDGWFLVSLLGKIVGG